MDAIELLRKNHPEASVNMSFQELTFVAAFAQEFHEYSVGEKADVINRIHREKKAKNWLIEIEFERWYLFQDIPAEFFNEAFELIDEGFRGWVYLFDDFDYGFRKELKIQKSTDREPLLSERRRRFAATNRRRFEEHQSNNQIVEL